MNDTILTWFGIFWLLMYAGAISYVLWIYRQHGWANRKDDEDE